MAASLNKESFNHENGHQLAWYVHRDKTIRNTLTGLWNKGPNDPKEMREATFEQKIVNRTNILFRNMEQFGPERREWSNYKYDRGNDFYHVHVSDGRGKTYVVLWEADQDKKIINIVNVSLHENLNYTRKHKKEERMAKVESKRDQDLIYKQHLLFEKKRATEPNGKKESKH